MTELWNCTDCPVEVDFNDRHEHMQTEHGVMYSATCDGCHEPLTGVDATTFERVKAAHEKAHKACPDCGPDGPCERAKALEGQSMKAGIELRASDEALRIPEGSWRDDGWMYPLAVVSMADAGMRYLLTIKPDGSFEMADDLTLQEARYVIEQITPMLIGTAIKLESTP